MTTPAHRGLHASEHARHRRHALQVLAFVPVALAGGLTWPGCSRQGPAVEAAAAGRRERRPTLDPALYIGKARRAHEVAREIPDVLDQLRCYCHCEGIGHVSLLSCYTDGHAAT
jgi:hypothetical protein